MTTTTDDNTRAPEVTEAFEGRLRDLHERIRDREADLSTDRTELALTIHEARALDALSVTQIADVLEVSFQRIYQILDTMTHEPSPNGDAAGE